MSADAMPLTSPAQPARDAAAAAAQPGWRRCVAVAALAGLVLLIVAGVAVSLEPSGKTAGAPRHSDAALYQDVIARVHGGQAYYPAAAQALRAGGYPLKPYVNIRPPLVAEAIALLPDATARVLACRLLVLAVVAAFALRLRPLVRGPVAWAAAALIAALGFAAMAAPNAYLFDETWAGLLIALSLAVHGRTGLRWGASIALALAAALARELALPFLLVMGFTALLERRRGEALAWAGAVGLFALATAIHAHFAMAQILPADVASPSWLHAGGWSFVLATAGWNGLFTLLPRLAIALVAPLALAGLFGWPACLRWRLGLTVGGYMAAFTLVGRPDNDYWGLVYAALLTLGLPFTLPVLRRLWRQAADRRSPIPAQTVAA